MDADRTVYSFGGFALDVARGTLSRDGVESRLRPKSYAVLRHLVEHAGRLVGKQELLDAVWGSTVVTEGSLTQCIVDIRRALGDTDQRLLRTIPRQGFMLDAAVTTLPLAQHAGTETVSGNIVSAEPMDRAQPPWRWAVAALLGVLSLGAITWWIITRDSTDAPAGAGFTPSPAPPANSIAVLRFVDLSPEGNQAYFADGLAEEILHELAASPALRVTARSSSFAIEPGTIDATAAARELGVAHVLEGSVRRAENELRVTAQLVDAGARTVVWSRTYDRSFEQMLQLQRDVAGDVATTLRVTLVPPGASPVSTSRAQESFLHGRYLFHRRASGDLEAAERHISEAVELDPRHARAWTLLAGVYLVRGVEEFNDSAHRLEDQRRALERALAVDPGLAEAHVRLGRLLARTGDTDAARAALARAYELEPDNPLVLFSRSQRSNLERRHDEAAELERRAVALDPLSAVYRGNLGRTLMAAGRYREALDALQRAAELSAEPAREAEIARVLLLLGRVAEARQIAVSLPGGAPRDQLVVLLDGATARPEAMRRLQSNPSPRVRIQLAEIAAQNGDRQGALALVEYALEHLDRHGNRDERIALRIEVVMSPFLRPLHDDPRWESLTASIQAT